MTGILPALLAGAIGEIASAATLSAAAQGVIGNRADAAFVRVYRGIGAKLVGYGNKPRLDPNEFGQAVSLAFHRSMNEHIETLSSQCRNLADRQVVDALKVSIAGNDWEIDILPREVLGSSFDGMLSRNDDATTNLKIVRTLLADRVVTWCSQQTHSVLSEHLAETFKSPAPSGAPSWLTVFRRQISKEMTRSPVIERVIKSAAIEDILCCTINTRDIVEGLDDTLQRIGSSIILVQDNLRSVRAYQTEQSLKLEQLENLIRTFRPRDYHLNSLRALGYAMFGGSDELRITTLISFEAWRADHSIFNLTRMQREQLVAQFLDLFAIYSPPACVCVPYEGAEFDIIASNVSGEAEISEICAIVETICAKLDVGDPASQSHKPAFGVATAPFHGTTPESIYRNSQLAFMRANSDSERIVVYDSSFQENARERAKLELQLKRAIENQEFKLVYQPQIDLETGSVISGEALLRWENPEFGFVSPSKFIPLAEDTGLISEIEQWALLRACQDACNWPGEKTVSLNISPNQLHRQTLSDSIMLALVRSGLAADRLEIELTESIFLYDITNTQSQIERLLSEGVRFALDDFGTGYSSLGYLSRFRFNKIKIDQSYVRRCGTPQGDGIVAAIVSLATSLEMAVVAEGVETLEDVNRVKNHRCRLAQGFYFSRPLDQAQFIEFCKQDI